MCRPVSVVLGVLLTLPLCEWRCDDPYVLPRKLAILPTTPTRSPSEACTMKAQGPTALRAALAVLICTPLCIAWDAQLTEELLGAKNREVAEAAEKAGEKNWTELGIGVDATGQMYVQQVARGKAYKHIRQGLLLVATGQTQGDIFDRAVILVVKHDSKGTLGLIINKPLELPAGEDLERSEVLEDLFGVVPTNPRALEHLGAGGPVGSSHAMYVHSGAPADSARKCYVSAQGGATQHTLIHTPACLPLAHGNVLGLVPCRRATAAARRRSSTRSAGRCATRSPRGGTPRARRC